VFEILSLVSVLFNYFSTTITQKYFVIDENRNMPSKKKFKGNFSTLNLSIEKDGSTSGNY
tara:strand:- start:365 stop:544 length:180 start_codon:yes stop_codon:yes gene_type:complete